MKAIDLILKLQLLVAEHGNDIEAEVQWVFTEWGSEDRLVVKKGHDIIEVIDA